VNGGKNKMVSLCCDSQERDLNFLGSRVLELAQEQATIIHKGAIKRGGQPSDFNFANDVWLKNFGAGTPNAWNVFTTFTVPDNTYIGIGGFFDLSTAPSVAKVKLGNASCVFRMFEFEPVLVKCEPEMILDQTEQIIFGPNQMVTISVYLTAADANCKFGIHSVVGEPAGNNVSYSGLVDP
jgi:hypothetical protein